MGLPLNTNDVTVSRYTDTTFILIIASEKGQGKSVRAKRMSFILPKGWCSNNSAASARAGMNGTLALMTDRAVVTPHTSRG